MPLHVSKIRRSKINRLTAKFVLLIVVALGLTHAGSAIAQNTSPDDFDALGTIWLLISAALVFFMNAGFAMLETGICRRGNAVNVLAKNLIVFCIATLAFWLFGFRFMFGDSTNGLWGPAEFLLNLPFPSETSPNPFPVGFRDLGSAWEGRSFASLFFFQLVFAGTAATIVSGAVAERIKFWAFILFSFVLVGFIYPLAGYWIWGGGWLSAAPIQFRDFAGSTVVHSVGGMAALVGAWFMQPRKGKFGYEPETDSFTGKEATASFEPYNLSLATLGCLILWLGWFGFNGGSTTDLKYVPHIIATTLFAAAAGGIGAVIFSPFVTSQKVSLTSIINGILGGLVGITASSAYVDITSAGIIGALSGVLVLVGENVLASCKIDDPVGAVPVHLMCGFWGTLAVGFFASPNSSEYQLTNYSRAAQIFYQFLGWLSVVAVVGVLSLTAWIVIGLVLYVLDQGSTKADQPKRVGADRSIPNDRFLAPLLNLVRAARQGIRVSIDMEEEGGDPTIAL